MTAADADGAITMALVNDYELVVRGLKQLLEPYADRIDIVELDTRRAVLTPVDIALYDTFSQSQVTAPEIDALLANPRVDKVVVYTWNMQPELVEAAWAKGVRGYLSKSLAGADLVAALERVYAGERVVAPSASAVVGDEPTHGDWPGRAQGLTHRQAEVVALITQGYRNDEIARMTYLSANTVKSYIREAYRRMGVTTRSQAVAWGIRNGLEPDHLRVTEPTHDS